MYDLINSTINLSLQILEAKEKREEATVIEAKEYFGKQVKRLELIQSNDVEKTDFKFADNYVMTSK